MKIISKEDAQILITYAANNCVSSEFFENILDRFGDDYYVVDGELVKVKENELMKKYREGKFEGVIE